MKRELLKVAIRQNAIYIPSEWVVKSESISINETSSVLLVNSAKLGYTFSEELYKSINGINPKHKLEVLEVLKEITGVNKNWTPLVKQWDIPTGETVLDHVVTFFSNVFKSNRGTKLPCGHLIPFNTFPLERYNGCPFCGTPFEFEELEFKEGKNKLKTLALWTEDDMKGFLETLLKSPVALDATQIDSLKVLLKAFGLPEGVEVGMKETLMVVIDALVENEQASEASVLFKNANDILRYLWYKHTGFLQMVEPKIIAKRLAKNSVNIQLGMDNRGSAKIKALTDLKLKFTRTECRQYAMWLNSLTMDAEKQCEIMHPKRGIWVRVIRALRLAEYSKRKGFENLSTLLDVFYNELYEVWQGQVNYYKLKYDEERTFKLLKERPGLFARSLFSAMLWFGKDVTLTHFKEVMYQVPPRLIFTLNMYTEIYFEKNSSRTVKPLGGTNKRIPVNKLLQLYTDDQLKEMVMGVQDLTLDLIKRKFENEINSNSTIFIDEGLFKIPIAIGDRSETVQDLPSALMGTRFPVEGSKVRLFLQWGEGLPAQHLDMDLSCRVAYENKTEFCSYSQLNIRGCKHSGDIQRIPNKVGTAEYIDVDVDELSYLGARYVSFTCNAYTNGSLSPNLVVGWMNSKYPMKITSKGVAYNPAEVQHQVRIQQTLVKGMVFGLLDVEAREVIWLELSYGGQVVQNLDTKAVESLLYKLDAKLKIGDLLKLKAEVQGLKVTEDAENADEVYDLNWVTNSAAVSEVFLS